jgi:pre-mRNA-splicing factor ATP-dependent RNA helicase DHX16
MVERWVSDKLHDILGISDRTIAEFLVQVAKKSSSEDSLISYLKANEVIDTGDANFVSFAKELYERVPHSTPKVSQQRIAEQAAVEQQRKSKKYQLIVSDDDDEDGDGDQPRPSTSTSASAGGGGFGGGNSNSDRKRQKHIRYG